VSRGNIHFSSSPFHQVVRALLDEGVQSASQADNNGRLPLHHAVASCHCDTAVVSALLEAHPQAVDHCHVKGMRPRQVAEAAGVAPEVISLL
jgi:ankyrin repeat protein